MKKVLLIGIGAGHPDHLTIQAVKALNTVDVFFFLDKGEVKSDLANFRKFICERFIEGRTYRFVEAVSPVRDAKAADYAAGVRAWHDDKATIVGRMIAEELADGQVGAFLVWGDPSLYDSTIRVIEDVLRSGRVAFAYEVIPGITSVQALAAQHKIALNTIGGPIQITTGRRIKDGFPEGADTAVVMLDDGSGLQAIGGDDLEIHWGAYLGTSDEILIAGKLSDQAEEIARVREQARARKGWIMDTYVLKRLQKSAG